MPIWLIERQVLLMHDQQLALFGGPADVRDLGLLASALDRPRNRFVYGERDLPALAAAYAFGISRSYPFVDGNKGTAFAALMVFLRLNGADFRPPVAEATAAVIALAAGELPENAMSAWISDRLSRASSG